MVKISDKDFPGIKDFKIAVKEPNPRIRPGDPHDTRYSIIMPSNDFAVPYLKCANTECTGQGYDIVGLLKEMIQDKKESGHGELVCLGSNKDGTPCAQVAQYEASITYKEEA